MISLFRNFFQSKIGLPIFIGFLIIVALAFAASDISGSATFGGLTGDDKIAVVGDEDITSNEMTAAINNGLVRLRDDSQNPTITMPQFVAQGGLENELDLLIDRYSTGLFAKKYGLRAGDNLVNSEILKIDAFKDLTGNFDPEVYQAALRRQNITDSILRRDISDGLLAQQILRPAFAAPQMPEAFAKHYGALVIERRVGQIGLVPSLEFAPEEDPSDAVLNTFYSENREDFTLPERRTIRYARFGAESVTADLTPSAEQIRARYEENADEYDAGERRAITSFVVPTQDAARALVQRIRSGTSLSAAAAEAGFNVSTGELLERADLASTTSAALAEAVFAAQEGAVIEPARASLGWYVARVDEVEAIPARSLDQVRDEIAASLRQEALAGALIDLSSRIEERVDTGTSLADVAQEFGLELTTVQNVLPDGRIYTGLGQGLNPAIRPILDTAFQMDENEPQLAEVVPGAQFLVFDVSDITESAPPPLDEVKDEVTQAWRIAEGSKAAKEAADRILEAVRGGESVREAMRAENASLVQVQAIDLERRELFASQQGRIPPALVLMFSMAEGSSKVLEDRGSLGWYVIDLDTIDANPDNVSEDVISDTIAQLQPALTGEYSRQLSSAIRAEIGVERNEEAIEALRKVLAGET